MGEVLFAQIALPEAELSVVGFCVAGTVNAARPIAAHGVEEIPDGFGVRPLADSEQAAESETAGRGRLSLCRRSELRD